ncbi:MAG: IS4 family transposase [Clostridia bacterium]|nr:IS4 family transposase [Clostridia bacterium]
MISITPKRIRKDFYITLQQMEADRPLYVKDPLRDFTRESTFSFQRTMLFLTQMESHSTNREINDFFLPLGRPVTQSAFVQARDKFNEKAFPALLQRFNKKYPFRKTKHGLHVFAIDGSDLNIPADKTDCSTFISYNSNQGGYHQLHVNLMYDLLEKRYSDVVIQPRTEIREAAAACDMVDRSPFDRNCLYIFDRGYTSLNLMAHIVSRNSFFLIRAKEINATKSLFSRMQLPNPEEFDVPVRFIVTRNRKLWKKNPCLYKLIHNDRAFDFIDTGDKESTFELCFRLVCVKLESGGLEYLITNLPSKKYSPDALRELYHLRWDIEKSFLFLKYGIALNYFHSVKREFLIQEIYSRLILSNFISLVVSCAELSFTGTKYHYKISISDAIYKCRNYLTANPAYKDVLPLLLRNKVPIRPNRRYPRNMRSQRLKSLQHRT